MNLAIYLIVGFVTFFIMWKKRGHQVSDYTGYDGDPSSNVYMSALFDITLTTLLWPIALPAKLAWQLLDRIWHKFHI